VPLDPSQDAQTIRRRLATMITCGMAPRPMVDRSRARESFEILAEFAESLPTEPPSGFCELCEHFESISAPRSDAGRPDVMSPGSPGARRRGARDCVGDEAVRSARPTNPGIDSLIAGGDEASCGVPTKPTEGDRARFRRFRRLQLPSDWDSPRGAGLERGPSGIGEGSLGLG
jgi:hypothetical protein